MSATEYPHVKNQRTVDGGHSGELTVTVADGTEGVPTMVFVDSDVLASKWVLTGAEAQDLGYVLMDAARLAGARSES